MLEGRAAVVTGSTSGIGRAIAEALAAEGCAVMLNGFGEAGEIERQRAGIADAHGVRVAYNPADMTRPDEIAALIAAAEAELGAVDILVNNAGIQHVAPIEAFPAERWDAVIAVDLSAAFHAISAALPGMKTRGWGRIINIASVQGLVGSIHKAAYVAAKHGLVGLTKVVALEAAESGVNCVAICPGWVRTPLIEKQIEARADADGIDVEEAGVAMLTDKQALPRFTTVEQIGQLAVYLCSDAASTITGVALPIDGGWTAQ